MSRIRIAWNPSGIKQLSFRGFRIFPTSPRQQLVAGLICTLFVLIGSFAASLLPIPNLNLLVFMLIGYFGAARIHPHPLVGSAFVALCITGASWSGIMLFPDPFFDMSALLLISLAANIFAAMTIGAVLATVLPINHPIAGP